jgi:hypothetical protein
VHQLGKLFFSFLLFSSFLFSFASLYSEIYPTFPLLAPQVNSPRGFSFLLSVEEEGGNQKDKKKKVGGGGGGEGGIDGRRRVLVGLSFQAVKLVVDCRLSFSWPPDRSRVERVLCLPPLQNPNDWDLCEFLKIFLQLEHLEFSFFFLKSAIFV